ncbi:hypothetical protein ACLB2K_014358 [Fragaria x ananassa]
MFALRTATLAWVMMRLFSRAVGMYGIAHGKPTKSAHIRGVNLQSSLGAGLAFGSEMSGGILSVLVERLHLSDSFIGIALKTTRGRGGYMKDIVISNVEMDNIHTAIQVTGQSSTHPDNKFDPDQLPFVEGITFDNMVGSNITFAGNFRIAFHIYLSLKRVILHDWKFL